MLASLELGMDMGYTLFNWTPGFHLLLKKCIS